MFRLDTLLYAFSTCFHLLLDQLLWCSFLYLHHDTLPVYDVIPFVSGLFEDLSSSVSLKLISKLPQVSTVPLVVRDCVNCK
jgi:hypothetical protein